MVTPISSDEIEDFVIKLKNGLTPDLMLIAPGFALTAGA